MFAGILTLVLFIAGFPLLLFGAEWLVKGASRLAVAWGISALAVGLTVVAYGTSMPELAVTVLAVWNVSDDAEQPAPGETDAASSPPSNKVHGNPDIAIGNVVGSNIANILLVLGICAVVAPLIVSREVVMRTMPVMIFISFLTLGFAWDWNGDGRPIIAWWQGLILFAGVILYTWRAILRGRAERTAQKKLEAEQADEIEEEFGHMGAGRWAWALEIGRIMVGMVCLVVGARWLVAGAVAGAKWLEVDELIISLTIVAIGTSLPEIVTCVVAVLRGHRDLAVGNAVGSNIFNILMVLGLCSIAAPGGGVLVSPDALTADIPIMIAVAVIALPVFYTGYVISRWEGVMFLLFYVAYTVYLILRQLDSSLLTPFVNVMLFGVLPITFAVLALHSAIDFFGNRTQKVKQE